MLLLSDLKIQAETLFYWNLNKWLVKPKENPQNRKFGSWWNSELVVCTFFSLVDNSSRNVENTRVRSLWTKILKSDASLLSLLWLVCYGLYFVSNLLFGAGVQLFWCTVLPKLPRLHWKKPWPKTRILIVSLASLRYPFWRNPPLISTSLS